MCIGVDKCADTIYNGSMRNNNTTKDFKMNDALFSDVCDAARSAMCDGDKVGEAACVAMGDFNIPHDMEIFDRICEEIR